MNGLTKKLHSPTKTWRHTVNPGDNGIKVHDVVMPQGC